ncbi:peptidase E [Paenibacillus mucilaginosus 3016]|uniref:Peptidase E n=2 Tax=Paenibacillus mucilaginosus TaxID=61624 RepID=H6NDB7_9BACL|nr:peptidase E [Paenibacillus mucilaginosus]AFC30630.1 peptidase E [Paenibacillus mucilaginosus 3016]AFH62942.1 peptidase [Paenibacillus mucilaginosus K02]WFA19242.1 peptidase E [Paenibacillus mucilaginosus]
MRQIIALGGGGFSMEPDNPLLDHYVLKQSKKSCPTVCFLPTASGDSESYIARFYASFHKYNCAASHLSLFKPPTRDLEDFILTKDIVYVGGGNTKNLLALWKDWGLHIVLRKAWDQGVVLAGISAGSICWFEEGVTDSYGDGLEPIKCLGFLEGSNCPHYDGEIERKPAFHQLIQSEKLCSGIAVDDGAGVHFIGQHIHKIVSSRAASKAYRVFKKDTVREQVLETCYLGEL